MHICHCQVPVIDTSAIYGSIMSVTYMHAIYTADIYGNTMTVTYMHVIYTAAINGSTMSVTYMNVIYLMISCIYVTDIMLP
jgi:hypothetical protein